MIFGMFEAGNIDAADGARMQKQHIVQYRRFWIPPFAANTEQLKRVLLERSAQFVAHGATQRTLVSVVTWRELNELATDKALRGYEIRTDVPAIHHEMQASFKASIQRAGGYLQLITAVAWRSWRLGMDSVTVGQSLGLTPCNVRVHLNRLREAARKLGYDVGQEHHSRGKKRVHKIDPQLAAKWLSQGKSWAAIMAYFGTTPRRNPIRRAIVKAGLVVPRAQRCHRPKCRPFKKEGRVL